ncbi:MAG TPA: hypothetical protein VKY74_18510 [Chloroflexia bacterium]|nr:hypothetical protein [Chloroflexia bacterium]
MRMMRLLAPVLLCGLVLSACDLAAAGPPTADPRTTIKQAKDYARTLASPPRIHDPTSAATDIDLWPDSVGSTTVRYSECGGAPTITPAGPLPADTPPPDPGCNLPMTLTTALTAVDADTADVVFAATWESGQRKHSWQIRVRRAGAVTLVQETGDWLPVPPA